MSGASANPNVGVNKPTNMIRAHKEQQHAHMRKQGGNKGLEHDQYIGDVRQEAQEPMYDQQQQQYDQYVDQQQQQQHEQVIDQRIRNKHSENKHLENEVHAQKQENKKYLDELAALKAKYGKGDEWDSMHDESTGLTAPYEEEEEDTTPPEPQPYEPKPYVSDAAKREMKFQQKLQEKGGNLVSQIEKTGNSIDSLITNSDLKYIFVNGKGGVGKTTNSAAIAIQLAIENTKRVLLVSIEKPNHHSLKDLFFEKNSKVDLLHPQTVPEFENLDLMEADAKHTLHKLIEEWHELAHKLDPNDELTKPGAVMDKTAHQHPIHALLKELTDKRGFEEAATLAHIVKHINTNRYGVIVFDTPSNLEDLLEIPAKLEMDEISDKHKHVGAGSTCCRADLGACSTCLAAVVLVQNRKRGN